MVRTLPVCILRWSPQVLGSLKALLEIALVGLHAL